MNIRVIAGKYGGRILDTPKGRRMHPMGERIRNALFNSIGSEVKDAQVLDAFAGTGSLGIEALSRGAEQTTFIEKDRVAYSCITNNINALGLTDEARAIKAPLASWIKTSEMTYDIIFADPPYYDLQLSTVSKLFDLLKPNGLMVLSWTGRGEVPNLKDDIVVVDNRSYGNARLTFFRRSTV